LTIPRHEVHNRFSNSHFWHNGRKKTEEGLFIAAARSKSKLYRKHEIDSSASRRSNPHEATQDYIALAEGSALNKAPEANLSMIDRIRALSSPYFEGGIPITSTTDHIEERTKQRTGSSYNSNARVSVELLLERERDLGNSRKGPGREATPASTRFICGLPTPNSNKSSSVADLNEPMAEDDPHVATASSQRAELRRYTSAMIHRRAIFRRHLVEPNANPNEEPGDGISRGKWFFNRGRDAIRRVFRACRDAVSGRTEVVPEMESAEEAAPEVKSARELPPPVARPQIPEDRQPIVVVADCELLHPQPEYPEGFRSHQYNNLLGEDLQENA